MGGMRLEATVPGSVQSPVKPGGQKASMKIEKTRVAAAIVLALALAGAGNAAQTKAEKPAAAVVMPKTDRIPMADFKKLLAKGDVVVIDVRGNESYVAGHIPGALSIPEGEINEAVAEKLRRMGKPVATYCS